MHASLRYEVLGAAVAKHRESRYVPETHVQEFAAAVKEVEKTDVCRRYVADAIEKLSTSKQFLGPCMSLSHRWIVRAGDMNGLAVGFHGISCPHGWACRGYDEACARDAQAGVLVRVVGKWVRTWHRVMSKGLC